MKKFLKKIAPLLLLAAVVLAMDFGLYKLSYKYHMGSYVIMNDFELTQRAHQEKEWKKVFFGNSSVIASYREELSDSGYINLGCDYGVATDLWDMIAKGCMRPTEELVLGFDYLTFYDYLDTNPSYIWHKGIFEPYAYFERDDLYTMFADMVRTLRGVEVTPQWTEQTKIVYHGSLSSSEFAEKIAYYEENYFHLPIADFKDNFMALEKIANWCKNHDVRFRLVAMPWNPKQEKPELMLAVKDHIKNFCEERNLEFLDFSDQYKEGCFYDVWHLNWEVGSYAFTEDITKWLKQ